MHTMKQLFRTHVAVIAFLLLAAMQSATAPEAAARAAAFTFDSVWFYRDGTRVVPEISRRWITVVFEKRYLPQTDNAASEGTADDSFIRKKARAIIKANGSIVDYLHDPNIAEDACFFRLRDGLTPVQINQLINRLNQDGTVSYVHPALVLKNQTFAYFNAFELEWKTGIPKAQRDALLGASHAVQDETAGQQNRYLVNVGAIPFFKALNLLAEDIRVLKVTPYLVEIKPSISARLALFMNGANIGDNMPFTITINFTDRVNIDPSSIATLNLRPAEIQKELFDCTFDPYDYAKAVTRSPIVITGRLRFYAPGEFTIPPIKISYSCPSCPTGATGAGLRSVETKPVSFRVASLIPKDKSENRLIVSTDPVAPELPLAALQQQSRRHLWIAIICFAALVPCAVLMLILSRKATVERRQLKDRKRIEKLAEQLRELLQATPDTPHWSYLGEAGALLREYLLGLYGIDAKYRGGSGRQFMETIAAHVPGECIAPLNSILTAIDNSVALETEHYQDIDRLQGEILNLVDLAARNGAAHG